MTHRRSMLMSVAAAAAAVLLLQTPATAVTAMRVNVPFEFVANGRVHAAGLYTIRSERVQGLLSFTDDTGNGFSVLTMNTGTQNKTMKPFLEFRVNGADHVLSAVYMPGNEIGFQLPGTGRLKGGTERVAIQR